MKEQTEIDQPWELERVIGRVSDLNPDPDSIGPVDPDPDSESGSRRAKLTHKSRKKFVKVHVLKCSMASFES
jgi:hypothetical protein